MIGTDLVRKRLIRLIRMGKVELTPVPVGVRDVDWHEENIRARNVWTVGYPFRMSRAESIHESHGDRTLNMMTAPNIGVSHSAMPVVYHPRPLSNRELQSLSLFSLSLTDTSLNFNYRGQPSRGQIFGSEREMRRVLEQVPVCYAAGNEGRDDNHRDFADHRNLLPIGAIEPTGLTTGYSNRSRFIAVLAPAGGPIHRTNLFQGDRANEYNGTSAAAPIVCGVLADVISISGQRLQGPHLRQLLQNASTPSPLSILSPPGTIDRDPLHQVPILNHYKLVRVAERIRERLGNEPLDEGDSMQGPLETFGFLPRSKNKSFLDRVLSNPSLYDFTEEARMLEDEALGLLEQGDCHQKSAGLDKMREAFLLHPSPRNRLVLSQIYRAMGHEQTASFYWVDSNERLSGSFQQYLATFSRRGQRTSWGSYVNEYDRFLSGPYRDIERQVQRFLHRR